MILLRALWRVIRAVGCGLGYAVLIGAVVSSPFFVLLRLQPPCNQAVDICEDSGLGLGAVLFLWLGMLIGLVTGMILSALRKRPISHVIRSVGRRLSHARPVGQTVGIVTLVTLVGTIGWLGYWVLAGRGIPPQVSLDIEIPFDQSLGVGLARMETFHQGGGCVRFGTREPDGSTSGFTVAHEISSTQSTEICPGVNQPDTQELLIVAHGDPADPRHPPSEIPVEVYMAPNWYDEPTFGAVSFPSPAPVVLELSSLRADVGEEPPVWRISLERIEDGFAVPVVTTVEGELVPSLWKLNEHGHGTDLSSQVGTPAWSHACDRHTCDVGWALVAWPSETNKVSPITIHMEIWLFDTDSDPILTIEECVEVAERGVTIHCISATD